MLLSVDAGYFKESDDYLAKANKILETKEIDWPSVFLPGGWNDAVGTFNQSGYGKIIVDAEGIVQGVNMHGKELERVVAQLVEKER